MFFHIRELQATSKNKIMNACQVPASFLRRTLTTFGDLLIFFAFAHLFIGLYILLFEVFTSFVGRYILLEGMVLSIVLIVFFLYLLVPKFLRGKTLFSYVTKVKIISTRNAELTLRDIVNRQKLLAFFWITAFCVFGFFMNPDLLYKIASKPLVRKQTHLLTHLEHFLFLVPATFSLFSFFASITCFISTARKSTPFFELYSNTQLIFDDSKLLRNNEKTFDGS